MRGEYRIAFYKRSFFNVLIKQTLLLFSKPHTPLKVKTQRGMSLFATENLNII